MTAFKPGVYFNMPEEVYHSIFALSASTAHNLRQSPYDLWVRSSLNPRLKEVEEEEGPTSEALILGRAFHKRILEGRAAFDANYAEKFAPEKGTLCTQKDLSAWLKENGSKVSGSKDEQIERIISFCKDAGISAPPIYELACEAYENSHAGKAFLDQKWMGRVEESARMIERHPYLKNAFVDGCPEVSIFWNCEVTGIPKKARIDYLKPKAIVSLKTMRPMKGVPHQRAIIREIRNRRYLCDAQFHIEAVSHVAEFLREQRAPHGAEDGARDLAKALEANHDKTFLFVFEIKGVAPVAYGIKVEPTLAEMAVAKAEVETLSQTFKECMDTYGSYPWIDVSGIERLSDEDLNSWSL